MMKEIYAISFISPPYLFDNFNEVIINRDKLSLLTKA
jgi:hypothetical protein